MKQISILLLSLSLLAAPVTAQESLKLDLEKTVEIAASQSRKSKMRNDELEAARYRRQQAFGRFLPKLTLSGRYSRVSHVEPRLIGTVPLGEAIDNQYSLRMALDQPVFTGFALRSGYRIAEYAEQLAMDRTRSERADVRAVSQEAYFNLLKARQMHQDTQTLVAALEEHLRQIQIFYDVGRATELEISRVRSRVAAARVSLVQTEGAEASAHLALTTLLGVPSTTPLLLADIVDSPQESGDVDGWVAQAQANRPEIAIATTQAAIASERVNVEAAGLWPQVSLRFGYNYDRPNQRYFPARDEFDGTWDLSAMVSWTAWDWGVTYYGMKAAEAEARAAKRNVEETRDLIRLDVERQRQNYSTAMARIVAAREALVSAEHSFNTMQILFEAGQAESLEVLDVTTELTQARSDLIQAQADARIVWALVQKSIGAE
jgi:outer membrane protein TolC